jgi:formate C-acetyltransferase
VDQFCRTDEFYEAEKLVIRGIQCWMERTVETINESLEIETYPELLVNLREMRETSLYLINGTPKTLRQACEWICWFNMASREYNPAQHQYYQCGPDS